MRLIRSETLRLLRERANDADRLEALISIAREQIREMKELIDQTAPLVAELPSVAEQSIALMRANGELRARAETAEHNYLLVGAALVRAEFPDHCEDD